MAMGVSIRELAERIADEIGRRYEVSRKVRDDDPYGGKPSMADIIERIIDNLIS